MTTIARNPSDCCHAGDCLCCDGMITQGSFSVSGVVNGGANSLDCDCDSGNDNFIVPANGEITNLVDLSGDLYEGCGGGKDFPVGTCASTPPWQMHVRIEWAITCNESGYWLDFYFHLWSLPSFHWALGHAFLGSAKPACLSISGSLNATDDTPFLDPGILVCNNMSIFVDYAIS